MQCQLTLSNWLKMHLGKMIGAYISTTTAIVVVNNFFPGFYGRYIPGILGASFITYWIRKIVTRKTKAGKNMA